MTLRTDCIEAMARAMARLEDEPEDRWSEYWALPAVEALDALLDTLTVRRDEWEDDAEIRWRVEHPRAWIPMNDVSDLLAVLRLPVEAE